MKSLLNNIWYILRTQLKSIVIQQALLKILGSAAAGGFRAWIIKKIVEYFYDEVADYVAEYGGYVYYKINGEINFRKLEKAKKENNEKEYDSVIHDIID